MKRILIIVSLLLCVGVICACEHSHKAAEEYKNDESYHWNPCDDEDCDAALNKAVHTWGKGEITTRPTASKDGVMSYLCTVCKRLKQEPVKYDANPIVSATQWQDAFSLTKFYNVAANMVEAIESEGVLYKREYKIQASEEAVYLVMIIYENDVEKQYAGKYQEGNYLWTFTDKNQTKEDVNPTLSRDIMRPTAVLTDNGFDKLKDMFDKFTYNKKTGCYEAENLSISSDGVVHKYKKLSVEMGDGRIVEIKATSVHDPAMEITVSYSDYGAAKPTPPIKAEEK